MVAISVVVGVFFGDCGLKTIIQIEASFVNLFWQLWRVGENRADAAFIPETTTDGVWFQF